ncbi:MAG: enoyl-CoA hydratase/isomerase family protein [Acetobacteraceae bacterium]
MSFQHLVYSVEDRVATLTLNRPERHNALNQALVDEIMEAVAQADADPEVRVVIVTGAGGKAFSAGYDIKESAEKPKRTLVEWRARMQKDIRFTYSVWDCSKPVIALIDGICYAGALEFAMCCDMRYCSDVSTFAAVEARFSNGIATMIMPWLIGQRSPQADLYRRHFRRRRGAAPGPGRGGLSQGGCSRRGDEDRAPHVPRFAGLPALEQAVDQPGVRDDGPAQRDRLWRGGLRDHGRYWVAGGRALRRDPPQRGPGRGAQMADRAVRPL